jgi:hypothetical protein
MVTLNKASCLRTIESGKPPRKAKEGMNKDKTEINELGNSNCTDKYM